ncbi:MAG: hypothetical protein QMD94_05730, partial [Candidatus Omnitrophota bacterium]|nr:hypothetical protein [Candidatus Omnitrophota bacterium]
DARFHGHDKNGRRELPEAKLLTKKTVIKKGALRCRTPQKTKITRESRKKQHKKKITAPKERTVTSKKKTAAAKNIIGIVTHYFPKVRAAVIKLKAPLATGDTIKIKGSTTDFIQSVTSIQDEHIAINSAKKGQEIGLLADSRVREHDIVYKIKENLVKD